MNTKCSIIEDLIPLYKECLCSEDTAAMVREHLEDCENCRRLLEDMDNTPEKKTSVPDESKVFRKVKKKMKRSKLKIALLSVILLAVIGGLGVLSFGQITHMEGLISFDTMIQSFETYRIAKLIADGDMEAYAATISDEAAVDANFNVLRNYDEIKNQNIISLNEAFEKYMKGREVSHVYSFGQYYREFVTSSEIAQPSCAIVNTATIRYKDGTSLELNFLKSYDGKYICTTAYQNTGDDYDVSDFGDVIRFVNSPKFFPDGLADVLFKKYNKEYFEKFPDRKTFLMTSWFIDEKKDSINEGLYSYYAEKGFTIDKFICSELRFDKESSEMYHDVLFEGCDDKGKALMTAKIVTTPEGLVPPAEEDIRIVADGCSDELVAALRSLFGGNR